MTTLFTKVTKTNQHFQARNLLRLATSAAAAVLGVLGSGIAYGQASPQIITLAQGFSLKETPAMQVLGPNDVQQTLMVFQAGSETGWHIHPGPVVVVVKTGALTETHADGCQTVHPAGSVFFESPGEVHNATNLTGGVAKAYVTFILPAGSPPLIPVPDPGRTCGQN